MSCQTKLFIDQLLFVKWRKQKMFIWHMLLRVCFISRTGSGTGIDKSETGKKHDSPTGLNEQEYRHDPRGKSNAHSLLMHCVIRVLKHLGCPYGCLEGVRGPQADICRSQGQTILTKLHRASSRQFSRFLKTMMREQPLAEILDFFHSYVGYCVDPSSLLSPLSKYIKNKILIVDVIFLFANYYMIIILWLILMLLWELIYRLIIYFAKKIFDFHKIENSFLYCHFSRIYFYENKMIATIIEKKYYIFPALRFYYNLHIFLDLKIACVHCFVFMYCRICRIYARNVL